MRKAVVLLSGGIDSAVCLILAVREVGKKNVFPITYDWRQLAFADELKAATALSREAHTADPKVVRLELPFETPLTDDPSGIHSNRTPAEIESGGIPSTFVPARNLIMVSYAFGIASHLGADGIYFGPCASDAAGYPDCRPAFVEAMERAGNLALEDERISLIAPLVKMSKTEVVRVGEELGVPWKLSFSCYAPRGGEHCGRCDSCVLRRSAFEEAGLESFIQ